MLTPAVDRAALATRWERFWFEEVPPHSFAVLRIAFGALAVLSMVGLTPVDMHWPLDGIIPLSSDGEGPRAFVRAAGWGGVAGYGYFVALLSCFAAMGVGYRADLAVLGSLIGAIFQNHWNKLPLSSAHQVLVCVLFCLMFTESGRVWSIDAWRAGRAGRSMKTNVPVWPLWLIRYQIAVIYGSSAIWKIAYAPWRDGSAVYWALNLNGFHRFPWSLPESLDVPLAALTWGTLLFEFSFPVLVYFRRTRGLVLAMGVGLHLGLWATLELGLFSWLMIASYLAFLDPHRVPELFRASPLGRFGPTSPFARSMPRSAPNLSETVSVRSTTGVTPTRQAPFQ